VVEWWSAEGGGSFNEKERVACAAKCKGVRSAMSLVPREVAAQTRAKNVEGVGEQRGRGRNRANPVCRNSSRNALPARLPTAKSATWQRWRQVCAQNDARSMPAHHKPVSLQKVPQQAARKLVCMSWHVRAAQCPPLLRITVQTLGPASPPACFNGYCPRPPGAVSGGRRPQRARAKRPRRRVMAQALFSPHQSSPRAVPSERRHASNGPELPVAYSSGAVSPPGRSRRIQFCGAVCTGRCAAGRVRVAVCGSGGVQTINPCV